MVRILTCVLAMLALACVVLISDVERLEAEKQTLEADNLVYKATMESNQQELEQLQASLAIKEQLAIKQQKDAADQLQQLKQSQSQLTQMVKTDDTVKDWADQPVPDGVSRLLRVAQNNHQDRAHQSATTGDPGATVSLSLMGRHNQPRAGQLHPGTASGP